jgi:cobalamin biosynthesis protein CobD/CbiB
VLYYSNPPYILLLIGLFVGATSGLAFDATLKLGVQTWNQNRSTRTLETLRGLSLFVPFIGINVGICLFLAAGLQVFGFPGKLAVAIALPLTVLTAFLVWTQLGKILSQLERGGSRALDLDSLS